MAVGSRGTTTNPKVLARIAVGKKRLESVLSRHGVALARTLEQKISDAGPGGQRVDPIYLTMGLHELRSEGRVSSRKAADIDWYHLSDAEPDMVSQRLDDQVPLFEGHGETI